MGEARLEPPGVLLVEDDELVRHTLQRTLAQRASDVFGQTRAFGSINCSGGRGLAATPGVAAKAGDAKAPQRQACRLRDDALHDGDLAGGTRGITEAVEAARHVNGAGIGEPARPCYDQDSTTPAAAAWPIDLDGKRSNAETASTAPGVQKA
jgi:hypothetical protein